MSVKVLLTRKFAETIAGIAAKSATGTNTASCRAAGVYPCHTHYAAVERLLILRRVDGDIAPRI
jgi:hypothetical protein